MVPTIIYGLLGLFALVLLWSVVSVSRGVKRGEKKLTIDQARLEFHQQRGELQQLFFETAAGSGRPRGLRWVQCDFATNDVKVDIDTFRDPKMSQN